MRQLNSPVSAVCSDARFEDNTEQEHAFREEGRSAVLSFDLAQLPKKNRASLQLNKRQIPAYGEAGRQDQD